ncbi:ATP-binding protein [Nakamurella sp. GG22]
MNLLQSNARIFDGVDGEMAGLLSARDWSSTPLGPVSGWSPVLRMMVPTMLRSGFPTVINWGPEMVALYNDAYVPLLGRKHPQAVGQSTKDTWPEAWEWVAPRLDQVLRGGRTVQFDNQAQILERNGYPEECYFTFSQSPIIDVDGTIGGIFTVATETTATILSERRMRIVRELGGLSMAGIAQGGHAPGQLGESSLPMALEAALEILGTARESLPFAVAFSAAPDGAADRPTAPAAPVAHYGLVPEAVSAADAPWFAEWTAAAARVIGSGNPEVMTGVRARVLGVVEPGPLGPLTPDSAVMMPLTVSGRARPVGAVLFGLNPYRILDGEYQAFLSLVVRQIRIVLTDALAHDSERHRLRALADLDAAKTEFFQNVSHELRTPLTLLLSPLRDMLQSVDGDDRPGAHSVDHHTVGQHTVDRDDLQAAVRAAERLTVMVDALLDFSDARAGVRTAEHRPTDLTVPTAEATSMFRSTAERAGLRFGVCLPERPVVAVVDAPMWATVVTNLVSNAVKYTRDGAVDVRLHTAGADAVLTVTDTGVGISAEQRAKVFERFYRASPQQGTPGAGIGLALVVDLVRALHGRVDLQSEPGAGTTVTVTVPLAAEPVSIADVPGSGSPSAAPDAPRVLVVEDDADLRRYLTRLLTRDGWAVTAVADAETALALAVSHTDGPPALVLTDVMLPGRSGLQLVSDLRATPATCRLPVIVVTGRGGPDAAEEGLTAGADDYITKPFSSPELLARVRANHELHQLREGAIGDAQAKAEQIRRGLDTNRTIGTAVGVIMATYRLSAEQAFRMLTTASQNTNSKLRDIAATVSETGALPFRRTDIDDLIIRTSSAPARTAGSTSPVMPSPRGPHSRARVTP